MEINFSVGKLKVEVIHKKGNKYYLVIFKNIKDNTQLSVSLREREFELLNKFMLQCEIDFFIKDNT